jgi:recombinational DNA repair ATPase RecF
LARYRQALTQKRRLLADNGQALSSWNEVMAPAARDLIVLRRRYVEALQRALNEVMEEFGLDLPAIEVRYRPSIDADEETVAAVLAALAAAGNRERAVGRPLVGPQRDEMEIAYGQHKIRRVGSAGERKALGLLLAAARGRVLKSFGKRPIFLLDDADSELDEQRLEVLWRVFAGEHQAFVSSNRPAVWRVAEEARRWSLEGGRLNPA